MEIFPYWDWCTASLLSVFNDCGFMVFHSVDRSPFFFFSSHFSPIGWSRRYEFRISLNLYTYTHRQLEFIALLCRVKEEKNRVDLCACIFIQTCRIFIPVCEFRGNGISLCMNYLYMIIYIAWAMRKVVLGKMVKILFFLERLDE